MARKTINKANALPTPRFQCSTEGQKETEDAYKEGLNLCLIGCAGNGKTFLSIGLALQDVMRGLYKKLIIVRSVVPSREIGYLPGSLKEKTQIYELPYQSIVNEITHRGDAWQILTEKGYIEFVTTSFLRGTTLRDCVIVFDEIQNCTGQEIETVVTRLGENTRILLCGDTNQCDLKKEVSGLNDQLGIIDTMESFGIIDFTRDDIVRSGFVREYIIAKEDYYAKK